MDTIKKQKIHQQVQERLCCLLNETIDTLCEEINNGFLRQLTPEMAAHYRDIQDSTLWTSREACYEDLMSNVATGRKVYVSYMGEPVKPKDFLALTPEDAPAIEVYTVKTLKDLLCEAQLNIETQNNGKLDLCFSDLLYTTIYASILC